MSMLKVSKEDFEQAIETALGNLDNRKRKVHDEKLETKEIKKQNKEERHEMEITSGIGDDGRIPWTIFKSTLINHRKQKRIKTSLADEKGILVDGLEEKFRLDKFLIDVLSKVKIPVSVTYINSYLGQRKLELLTEDFMKDEGNQEHFCFILLGTDLKIYLQDACDDNCCVTLTKQGTHGHELLELIQKDISRLRELKAKFVANQLDEVPYSDFIKIYSTKKCRMNLPFIVRNSHALEICRKAGDTFIRFTEEEKQVVRVWDVNKGFEDLLLNCAKELLARFTVPLNQGLLQNCFKFGHDVMDKRFLNKYHKVFESHGSDGVSLKGNMQKNVSCDGTEVSSDKITIPVSTGCVNLSKGKQANSQTQETINRSISLALREKRSIIIPGSNELPPVFYYDEGKCQNKLAALRKLNDAIVDEIQKVKKGIS